MVKDVFFLPNEHASDAKKYDENIINEDISVVVSCKDREEMLSVEKGLGY